MQQTQVPSLIWEDPTYRRASKSRERKKKKTKEKKKIFFIDIFRDKKTLQLFFFFHCKSISSQEQAYNLVIFPCFLLLLFSLPCLFSFSTFNFAKSSVQQSCKIFLRLVLCDCFLDTDSRIYDLVRELHGCFVYPTEIHQGGGAHSITYPIVGYAMLFI